MSAHETNPREIEKNVDGMHDVAIIGAGPIGIELHAGLRQAGVESIIHLEAGQIGSTIGWWSPETRFFSSPERIEICGITLPSVDQTKATREQYLAYLRSVVQQLKLPIETFRRVTQIRRQVDGNFEIKTARSTHGVGGPDELRSPAFAESPILPIVSAKRIVLAIGNMHRPRMLNVPGEGLPHVSHYLGEVHRYFNQRVLIVGGKNSAVEAAIRLYRAGAHVTMSYRGEEFDPKRVKYWLKPELEWLIRKQRIAFHPRTAVENIDESGATLRHLETGARTEVNADFVLLLTGYMQDASLFEEIGIELEGDERMPAFERETMETNVPNVYVAGTAAGGSQERARFYIENTHVHVRRIVKAITGAELHWTTDADFASLEES